VADSRIGGDGPADRPSSLRRATVRGARLALAGYVVSRGILFFVYVVLARLITPADFGRYAAASVVVGVGVLFAESGMMSALIQRRDRLEEAASTAFFSLLIGGVLLSLGALALAPVLGAFFQTQHVTPLAAVLAPGMLLRSLTVVPDALLQRRFSFARRVAVDPLGAIGFAVASIVACANGAGAWGLVAGSYASLIIMVISGWWFARFRPRLRLASVKMWRELASFARHVLGSEILARGAQQIDTVMIGRVSGAAPLGQYRNGLRLAQQPSDAYVSVIAYVLLPALARLADDAERLHAVAKRIFGLVSASSIPVSLAFLPLGEPAAVLLLGPQWRPAGHAISALCGLTAATTVISFSSEVFKAVGKPKILVHLYTLNLAVLVVVIPTAALTLGFVGVAAAISVSQVVTAAFALRRVAPLIAMSWREMLTETTGPLLAGVQMVIAMFVLSAAVKPLHHSAPLEWAWTVVEALAGAFVYGAVLLLVDRSRRQAVFELVARRRAQRKSLVGVG